MSKRSYAEVEGDGGNSVETSSHSTKRAAMKQDHSHRPSPSNIISSNPGWNVQDEAMVRHILSAAAATKSDYYASSTIYSLWSERMRGAWMGRKTMDAAAGSTPMQIDVC